MKQFNYLKSELLDINQDLCQLVSSAKTMQGMPGHTFGEWEKTCGNLSKHLAEDIIRVAVIGSIKSGKSTFVNAVLKGDFLKRGAGVVTSFVTKVRYGRTLSAKLLFKSIDEINEEITPALVLIPSYNPTAQDGFDISNEKVRMELQQALDALNSENLITNDLRNINGVVLSCFLSGYDKVKSFLSQKPLTVEYDAAHFIEHRKFVGDETLAVYLRDIELKVNSDNLESNLEIADCQGSDSSNPLHLALIQDYLIQTNLILYVISSRTGIRRADIRFLSMIKKMGILDNVLFVVNCDFSEHDSLDNLQSVIRKIDEEISLIKPLHELYALSVLFELFKVQQEDQLSEKDLSRLTQWKKESDFVDLTGREFSRFKEDLRQILRKKHISLLLKNNLERHNVMISGMSNWVNINKDLVTADKNRVHDIDQWIKGQQKQMSQIKSMLDSTLGGAVTKLKKEINMSIVRFFDVRSGSALSEIVEFMRNYRISYKDFDEDINESSFSNAIYVIYQEYKQALDHSIAKAFNPAIVQFIKKEEQQILAHFQSLSEPFERLVDDARVESNKMLEDLGIATVNKLDKLPDLMPLDTNSVKVNSGLTYPPFVASMRFSVKIKTEAVMRFGYYSVMRLFQRLLKKPIETTKKNKIKALKGSVKIMKRETEKSFLSHIQNYRANIKYQYLHRFVEEVSRSFNDSLIEGLQTYVSGLSEMVKGVQNKQVDKEQAFKALNEMEKELSVITERVETLRSRIDETGNHTIKQS